MNRMNTYRFIACVDYIEISVLLLVRNDTITWHQQTTSDGIAGSNCLEKRLHGMHMHMICVYFFKYHFNCNLYQYIQQIACRRVLSSAPL
jgi:hypothetical protein